VSEKYMYSEGKEGKEGVEECRFARITKWKIGEKLVGIIMPRRLVQNWKVNKTLGGGGGGSPRKIRGECATRFPKPSPY